VLPAEVVKGDEIRCLVFLKLVRDEVRHCALVEGFLNLEYPSLLVSRELSSEVKIDLHDIWLVTVHNHVEIVIVKTLLRRI